MKEIEYELTELSLHLLKKDLLYRKLNEKERDHIIDSSIEIGRKAAEQKSHEGLVEHNIKDFIEIFCTIHKTDRRDSHAFSEFSYPKNIITLYMANIEKAYINLLDKGYQVDFEKFTDVFLLHEFFHYVEENEIGSLSQLFTVQVFKIFGYTRKVEIRMVSEIGANAFLRNIIGTPLHYISEGGFYD